MGRTRDALKRFRTAATLGARGAAEMETGLLMWDAGLNEDASRCFANALEPPTCHSSHGLRFSAI
jgi:hypothetical protein